MNPEQILNITLPCSMAELKSAYRQASFNAHPDHGGTSEAMRLVLEAYNSLKNSSSITEDGVVVGVLKTVSGIPLTDLGLGLGPTKNSVDCKQCQAKGYTEYLSQDLLTCKDCDGEGWTYSYQVDCKPCNGTGKFIQTFTKKEVTCRVCKGTGKFLRQFYHIQRCQPCDGLGRYYKLNGRKLYNECSWCAGTGQREIYNPVLPKARLMARI